MSLSDCAKCWDTPCTCGWDYRDWSVKGIHKHINMLNKVLEFKELYPDAKFSGDERVVNEKAFMDHMRTGGY